MSSKYIRCIWNRYAGATIRFKSVHKCVVRDIRKPLYVAPCLFGFSIFTWLGFDKDKPTAEDELINTIKHCVLFMQRSEYDKSEQLLHVALRQAQNIHHEMGITYIYDLMANLALEREELSKAKKLFVAVAQRVMADGATEDDLRVVHLSSKLARVSHLQKEYSTAQIGYDWCIQKLGKVVETEPTDEVKKLLAMTEDWYGRLFLDCNDHESGLKYLLNAYNRMKELNDIEKEHLVIQLNDIGTVCDLLGKTDESIQYFKEALEIAKPLKMEDLGTMHVNLGRVYIKKQLFDAARKSCGHAWKLAVMTKNKDVKKEAEMCINEINGLV